jgi:hypothetical protein
VKKLGSSLSVGWVRRCGNRIDDFSRILDGFENAIELGRGGSGIRRWYLDEVFVKINGELPFGLASVHLAETIWV